MDVSLLQRILATFISVGIGTISMQLMDLHDTMTNLDRSVRTLESLSTTYKAEVIFLRKDLDKLENTVDKHIEQARKYRDNQREAYKTWK